MSTPGAGGGIELPFGGISRHGREKGFKALYEFSTLKTIIIKHDLKAHRAPGGGVSTRPPPRQRER